jgi:2-polyprenyl-6-methoxyphenol hydroxylase-like FAD-dependent oxidoreductase
MAETYDVITIGGGLAGAALAKRLAENGVHVLVLEREVAFRDRVRGEQMHSWGVAEARTLGLYQTLLETCGHKVRYWSDQLVGFSQFGRRDLVKTSQHRAGSLNFYHPDMQAVVIGAAAAAGAKVRRGARVVELVSDGLPGVRVHEDGNGERVYRARLVVGADDRNSVCRRWGGFHVERDPEGHGHRWTFDGRPCGSRGSDERFFKSAPQHALFDGSARRRSLPRIRQHPQGCKNVDGSSFDR